MSRSHSLQARKSTTPPSPHSRSVSIVRTGSCIAVIASIFWLSIRFGMSSPSRRIRHVSLTSNSAYSTHTTPHPGTHLPRKSHPHYSATVEHVRRSQLSFQSSEICVSVKVRASCVHPAGGIWACQEAKTPTVSWLSHSPIMNLGGSIHDLYHQIFVCSTTRLALRVRRQSFGK